MPGHTLMHTALPAWDTYFFIYPYGPAKLWNVKKYVFQARNSLARQGWLVPCGSPLRVGGGEARPREAAWKGTGCVPVGIVLPLFLCQQVEALVRH